MADEDRGRTRKYRRSDYRQVVRPERVGLPQSDTETGRIESLREGDPYPSRKNTVFRAAVDGRRLVAKVYAAERSHLAAKELSILQDCVRRGVRVPGPIGLRGRALLVELVEGANAAEQLDSLWEAYLAGDLAAAAAMTGLVDGVSGWLAGFHKAFGFKTVRGDAILKNFVLGVDGVVTGLDLEESMAGDPIDDIGQLCAFVISMYPAFTAARFALAGRFADRYWDLSGTGRARAEVGPAVARALRHYSRFREDAAELVAWAERIERGEVRL